MRPWVVTRRLVIKHTVLVKDARSKADAIRQAQNSDISVDDDDPTAEVVGLGYEVEKQLPAYSWLAYQEKP